MFVSEARIQANRFNAQKSTGPKSEEGKAHSRANGLKHGLAGEGVVMPERDLGDVEALAQALLAEFNPQSAAGEVLVRRMAVCSIQMNRGAEYETASIAKRVRHAAEEFDDGRFEEAESLIATLVESPRTNVRRLKRTPEGVDRLIEEWEALHADLTRLDGNLWGTHQVAIAALLSGLPSRQSSRSDFVWLSETFLRGDTPTRKAEAHAQLLRKIEGEIEGLKTHRETLDFDLIELDRSEAGSRVLFDPSKEATLARRYESEAQRNYFRALNELRRVEAELAAQSMAEPAPSLASSREPSPEPVVSRTEVMPAEVRKPKFDFSKPIFDADGLVRDRDGQVLSIGKPPIATR